jgi:DNA repair photolyase
VGIAISIPTFDEVIRKHFEPDAPAIPGRLEAIRQLVAAGLRVNVNWAPILPGVTDNRETAMDYFARISTLGVRRVMCNTLSYTDFLGQAQNKLAEAFYEKTGRTKPRSLPGSELKRIVEVLGRKYGVRVLV